jgi:hypothetical protein
MYDKKKVIIIDNDKYNELCENNEAYYVASIIEYLFK